MVYVHIPYCQRRCTYCSFYSETRRGETDAYLDALEQEFAQRADGHKIKTLYIGGGTPTMLGMNQLERLFNAVGKAYDLSELEECTVECNPEHLSSDYLRGLRSIGVINRLSVGVQSFDDTVLRIVNRIHGSATAERVLRSCAEAGFENLSLDLIFGLPKQSVESFANDLERVGSLIGEGIPIHHLSFYALTMETGSILWRQVESHRIEVPDEDTVVDEYNMLQQWRRGVGMMHYEVSNYCHNGYESKHNSRYWDRTKYEGYGAGAHSFTGSVRRWNVPDTKQYINGIASGCDYWQSEELDDDDAFNEYVMTSLRTSRGLDRRKVGESYLPYLDKGMSDFVKRGWVVNDGCFYMPTEAGMLWADHMAASLFL